MSKQHLKCKYDPATFKLGFKWEDVIPPGYKVSNVEAEITGEEDAIVRYELHEVLVPFSS